MEYFASEVYDIIETPYKAVGLKPLHDSCVRKDETPLILRVTMYSPSDDIQIMCYRVIYNDGWCELIPLTDVHCKNPKWELVKFEWSENNEGE